MSGFFHQSIHGPRWLAVSDLTARFSTVAVLKAHLNPQSSARWRVSSSRPEIRRLNTPQWATHKANMGHSSKPSAPKVVFFFFFYGVKRFTLKTNLGVADLVLSGISCTWSTYWVPRTRTDRTDQKQVMDLVSDNDYRFKLWANCRINTWNYLTISQGLRRSCLA